MRKIIAINGSTRSSSSNGLLLSTLGQMFDQSNFFVFESISLLPHFNPDLDIPKVVLDFKRRVNLADYLLIVTPEYAHGVPGVLKNALDWLVSDENLPGKEVIVMVCSAGEGDYAMSALVEILKTMSLNVDPEKCVQVSSIRSKFKDGELIDANLQSKLTKLVDNLKS